MDSVPINTVAALTVSCGETSILFDDDELLALNALSFLYSSEGAKPGRLLVCEGTLSDEELVQLRGFLRTVESKLDEPLTVYDHGRGFGTVCFQHRGWYELVKSSGVRYVKPTLRYVKGEKGKLASIDDVVYANGRRSKQTDAKPQALRDIAKVASAVDKLAQVIVAASGGAPLVSTPRQSYVYF